MKLVKHTAVGRPTTYTIEDISTIELGYIQLGLIMSGQPEVRVDEHWGSAPVTTTPVDGAYRGRHGPHYRARTGFVIPRGIVLRPIAPGRIHAYRWEVYAGYTVPKDKNWEDQDARYIGDVVNWTGVRETGWSWQPKEGESQDFSNAGPVADILSVLAREIRNAEEERMTKANQLGLSLDEYDARERRDHGA